MLRVRDDRAEVGPLEAHHHPIERSMVNMIDWDRFSADCKAGVWGPHAQAFDWSTFDPADPYTFVDDMAVNGILLAKRFHTDRDAGIHAMRFPLWIAQKYGKDGYQFSPTEVIHHDGGHPMSEKFEVRLEALEAKVDENSRLTKELLTVFSTVEAGFKVLAGVGQAARWAAPILTAVAAIWALMHGNWRRVD